MAIESVRDIFPGEWMGKVERELGEHSALHKEHREEFQTVHRLIDTLAAEQKITRTELGQKIDHVATVIETSSRAIKYIVSVVGVVTPVIMLILALKDVI